MAERGGKLKTAFVRVNKIAESNDQIIGEMHVVAETQKDADTATKLFVEATNGQVLEEVPIGINNSTRGKTFTTGFDRRNKNPNRATWTPSGGAWENGSETVN